jgi:hypothetical protein
MNDDEKAAIDEIAKLVASDQPPVDTSSTGSRRVSATSNRSRRRDGSSRSRDEAAATRRKEKALTL